MNSQEVRSPLGAIVRQVALTTAGAIAVSWAINYLMLLSDTLSAFARSAITATLLPILLVAPIAAALFWTRAELKNVKRASSAKASRDPATGHLDQSVLAIAVEERRKHVDAGDGPLRGAFLLLELDDLRKINAQFGPEWSASALSLVAQTVRKSVRAGDLVGRLETGEFGIFLPQATEDDAIRVGDRIVQAIASAYFAPDGVETIVTVRVAGIVFERELEFSEMVQQAASQLGAADVSTSMTLRTLSAYPS